MPVYERVDEDRGRRCQLRVRRERQAPGEERRHDPGEKGDHARIEAAEQGAARQVERHHDGVRARQVGVVAQDGVAAVGRPEIRRARLLAEHAVGVVGPVGALPFEQAVEGEGKLDDAAVLAVGPARGRAEADEGQRRQRDEDERRAREQRGTHARPPARDRGCEVRAGQADRQRGEQQRHRIAVERPRRMRHEWNEPAGEPRQPRLVEQPPRENPWRVVQEQVARHEQERAGNDGRV